ncbi:hypothetical protein ACIG56_26750 [Nocardia fusca]|uniref:hypothetical protein n=1 Tax=Nocardia fusca TaxID=941183 RepID=UPI0037C8D29A
MVSSGKLAVALAATALSASAITGCAHSEPEAAVNRQETAMNRHEGVVGCVRWWWIDSEMSTLITTFHWHNHCPTEVKLMVSWRNHRTNMNPDDVLYGIPAGGEGSSTWAGIPVSFKQL